MSSEEAGAQLERHRIGSMNWHGLGVSAELDLGPARCAPLTDVGEVIEARPERDRWRRAVLRPLRWLEESPHRRAVDCAQAARCPGCVFRHLSEGRQRAHLEASHRGALERLSGRDLGSVQSRWWPAPHRDGYRARLQGRLSLDAGRWSLTLGDRYREQPVDLLACPVQSARVRRVSAELLERLSLIGEPLPLTMLTLQLGASDGEGRGGSSSDPNASTLAEGLLTFELSEALSEQQRSQLLRGLDGLSARLSTYLRVGRDGALEHLGGPISWGLTLGEWRLRATPPAWVTQSPESYHSLIPLTLDALKPTAGASIWEIGCGIGALSLPLAAAGYAVRGVDHCAEAIEDARWSAAAAGLEARARFQAADGRRALGEALKGRRDGTPLPRLAIIHAMRRPLPNLLYLFSELCVDRLLYLAPSAPALARDLADAPEWALTELHFLDQMPGTAQVMTGALLCRC